MRARNDGRQPCERRSHVPTTPYPQPGASLVAPLPLTLALRCALLGLSAVGAGLLGGGLAHAQSVGQHSAATRLDDATPRSYDIPAGSLGASLGAFASQSGLLLSFAPR